MRNLTALILALFIAVSAAFAQDESAQATPKTPRIGVGAKMAFDYGMIYGMEDEDDDVDGKPSGMGFDIGLALRLKLVENFYFAPEFNFAYIKTEHKYTNITRRYTRMDMEIPLMLRGVIAQRFYANFGPQLGLNLSNSVKAKAVGMDLPEDFDQAFFEFGVAVGAGVNVAAGLFVDFRIYMGMTELFPDVAYLFGDDFDKDPSKDTGWSMVNMADAKNLKFKIGISYWFI